MGLTQEEKNEILKEHAKHSYFYYSGQVAILADEFYSLISNGSRDIDKLGILVGRIENYISQMQEVSMALEMESGGEYGNIVNAVKYAFQDYSGLKY